MKISYLRAMLLLEFILLFVAVPVVIFFHTTRWNAHITLWIGTLYAIVLLSRAKDFSWRDTWYGAGWNKQQIKFSALRYIVSTFVIVVLTYFMMPDRLFSFPVQRTGFWLLVMALYPVLSALPQEVLFRVFFFKRYEVLFGEKWLPWVSAFIFGFIHIVFHNWVAPVLSALCGFFIAWDYSKHRSLGVAMLEHALYGDMVFTIGIGLYFLVH